DRGEDGGNPIDGDHHHPELGVERRLDEAAPRIAQHGAPPALADAGRGLGGARCGLRGVVGRRHLGCINLGLVMMPSTSAIRFRMMYVAANTRAQACTTGTSRAVTASTICL